MVRDLVDGARARLEALAPASPDAIRAHAAPIVAFSPGVAAGLAELRGFLRERVYRHYKVSRMTLKARRVVRELADALLAAPECLPDGWREPGRPAPRRRHRRNRTGLCRRHDRPLRARRA